MDKTPQNNYPSRWGDVMSSFQFVWEHQPNLFKRLASPIIMMATSIGLMLYSVFIILKPFYDANGKLIESSLTVQSLKTSLSYAHTGIFVLSLSLLFMASLMIPVRLYRYMLGEEDSFFSFGRREMRLLWNGILVSLCSISIASIIGGGLALIGIRANLPFITITGCILAVFSFVYIGLRLSLIFPAVSLDHSTKFKNAWDQMQGKVGRLFWTLVFMQIFLLFISLVFGVCLFLVIGAFALLALVSPILMYGLPIILVPMYSWLIVFSMALPYKITANYYQRQVLDNGIS